MKCSVCPKPVCSGRKIFPRSEQHLDRDLDSLLGPTFTDADTLALIPSVTF